MTILNLINKEAFKKILGNECCKVKKIFFSIFLSENLESS